MHQKITIARRYYWSHSSFTKHSGTSTMCISEPLGFLTQTSLALIAPLGWRYPPKSDHWRKSLHHICRLKFQSTSCLWLNPWLTNAEHQGQGLKSNMICGEIISSVSQGLVLRRSNPSWLVQHSARCQADRSQGSCQVKNIARFLIMIKRTWFMTTSGSSRTFTSPEEGFLTS